MESSENLESCAKGEMSNEVDFAHILHTKKNYHCFRVFEATRLLFDASRTPVSLLKILSGCLFDFVAVI